MADLVLVGEAGILGQATQATSKGQETVIISLAYRSLS